MRRFAAGARRAWQDAQQKTPTGVQQKSRRCLWWRRITDFLVATLTQIRLTILVFGTETSRSSGSLPSTSKGTQFLCYRLCAGLFGLLGLGTKWCSNQTTSQPSRHQSNGAAENAVRRIESLTRTYVCVLQEKIGYKVDSKSIILPWLVRHAAYVLNRYIKRDDGRSAWARLRGKECDSPLAQIGETVDFKIVRGEMAKTGARVGPWELSWGRTDESDEVIVGTAAGIEFARSFRRRAANKQWERDAFTTFVGVPWNPRGLAVEAPVASSRRRYITKALIHQHGETPGCAACLGTGSQHTAKCRDRFEQLINPSVTDEVPCGIKLCRKDPTT